MEEDLRHGWRQRLTGHHRIRFHLRGRRAAAVSPFHFSHGFKQTTGLSPRQFVIRQRIERAKTLLRTCDESIAQIALSVGFANQSHFTTVFNKHCGMTPKSYRDDCAVN